MKFTRSGMPSPLRDVIDGKNANRKLKMPNEKKSKELVEVENHSAPVNFIYSQVLSVRAQRIDEMAADLQDRQ